MKKKEELFKMEKENQKEQEMTINLTESEVWQIILSLDVRSSEAKIKAALTFNESEFNDMNGLSIYLTNLGGKLKAKLNKEHTNNDKQ